jgi:hypothetical protein
LAILEVSSVNRWYGLEGFGRAKAGAQRRVSLRLEKQQRTMEGEVSGPVGVSLAALYSGWANEAKLGIQCLKKPMKHKNKISWASLGGWRSLKI